MSESLATAGSPSTSSACGLTGWIWPANPAALRVGEEHVADRGLPAAGPTTATTLGPSRARTLWDSARCSRAMATALDASVGSMSKCTATTPSSDDD